MRHMTHAGEVVMLELVAGCLAVTLKGLCFPYAQAALAAAVMPSQA